MCESALLDLCGSRNFVLINTEELVLSSEAPKQYAAIVINAFTVGGVRVKYKMRGKLEVLKK